MSRPSLSVIVLAFECAPYIGQALQSLRTFTGPALQVIVVEPEVDDGSASEIESFSRDYLEVERVKAGPSSPGVARNTGLDCAAGDFIYFLDGDDLLVAANISEAMQLASTHQLDLLIGRADEFDDEQCGQESRQSSNRYQLPEIPGNLWLGGGPGAMRFLHDHSSYSPATGLRLWRRESLLESGARFPDWWRHEDNVFAAQTLLSASSVAIAPLTLFMRRVRQNSLSRKRESFRDVRLLAHASREVRIDPRSSEVWADSATDSSARRESWRIRRSMLRVAGRVMGMQALALSRQGPGAK